VTIWTTPIYKECKTHQIAITSVNFLGLVVKYLWIILGQKNLSIDKNWIRIKWTLTMFIWVEPRIWQMRYVRIKGIRWTKPRKVTFNNQMVEIVSQWEWNNSVKTSHLWVEWLLQACFNQIHSLICKVRWVKWDLKIINLTFRLHNQLVKKAWI